MNRNPSNLFTAHCLELASSLASNWTSIQCKWPDEDEPLLISFCSLSLLSFCYLMYATASIVSSGILIYNRSTTPRLGDMMLTTLPSNPKILPPRVATRLSLSVFTPSSFSRFTDAKAIASALDILLSVSRAA